MTRAFFASPTIMLAIFSLTWFNALANDNTADKDAADFAISDVYLSGSDVSEMVANEVELKTLKKPIRKFIEANPNVEQYTETCQTIGDCEEMYYMVDTYYSSFTPEEVMQTMSTSAPQDLWTKSSKFQLGYYPSEKSFYTFKDDAPAAEENMIVILQIKLLGLKSIPASFKITKLDPNSRTIEFSYVEENGNRGIQSLRVYADDNGSKIVHETQYKSGKGFRDKVLYPFIHAKLTDGFYKNLESLMERTYQ